MGASELFLEHRQNDKVKRYVRIRSETDAFLIGSSLDADLRLLGEDVSGCHVILKYREPHWYVCHVSPEAQTTVNDQSIVEEKVDSVLTIEIGSHQIRVAPAQASRQLFIENKKYVDLSLHQVVVRNHGKVYETKVLKAGKPFKFWDTTGKHVLHSPPSSDWVSTEFGHKVVSQRLISAQEMMLAEGLMVDRDLRRPMIGLAILVLLFVVSISMIPDTKSPEVALDQKSLDMIFNAKMIKKRRTEAKNMVASSARKGETTDANQASANHETPDTAQAPTVHSKTAQAIKTLRESGLARLIGKIAKRASHQGIMVATTGASPDQPNTATAFLSHGTTTMGGGGAAQQAGTYKIGGVATQGKGGGSTSFKQGTALSGGSVGQGDVVISDDETVIEGGLDRDVIADVIRRNLGQIRYCYERQLSSNRDLYGKVMVKFVIGAGGEVDQPKIDSSTMKSAMVEGCILRRVAAWKFPLPKGGTTVRVSYPFLFKALD